MKLPVLALIAITVLPLSACSAVVDVNLALEGMPKTQYVGSSTVTTKYLPRAEVSRHCSQKLNAASKLKRWYNACVYTQKNGDIIMVMPPPGTLNPQSYAKLLEHEYQHVGQAVEGRALGHEDWK